MATSRVRRLFRGLLLLVLASVIYVLHGEEREMKREQPFDTCGSKVSNLALLTSVWADPHRSSLHRAEVLGSLILNLLNPAFSLVFVVLDGADAQHNCDQLRKQVGEKVSFATRTGGKFGCLNRQGGQPTYREMFSYSTRVEFRDAVVVLANADIVFDDTIELLSLTGLHTIAVIPTQGLHYDNTSMFSQYEKFVESQVEHPSLTPSRCYAKPEERNSWDAYAFHPESVVVDDERMTDLSTGRPFYMNEIWAENSALHSIVSSSPVLTQVVEVCDHVNAWHFHLASKMHRYEDLSARVEHPGMYPNHCFDACTCLTRGKQANNHPSICTARPDICNR